MIKDMIFGLIGGIGLFLFGMSLMSDGLRQVAGQKLKKLLETLTTNTVMGVLVGAMVTCLIQASGATTVMVVGLVNAGLLTLRQSLGVILGSNIGTTITAWIVSLLGIGGLEIMMYTLPFIGIGFLFVAVGKTQKTKGIGNIILGLGLLFLGLTFMSDAFGPDGFDIGQSTVVQGWLVKLGENPLLGVLAGAIFTALMQSSSAFIAIIQILALKGAFGSDWELVLHIAIPFVLGSNIGTTITAPLAALQASRNAKRAAFGHVIFNLVGTVYFLPLLYFGIYTKIVMFVAPWDLSDKTIMAYIAISHTIFNVLNTIIFLPLVPLWEALVIKIIPVTKRELTTKPVVLEKHLFHTPVLALEQAKREIIRMTEKAKDAVHQAVRGLLQDDERRLFKAREGENVTDEFQTAITSYLVALSREQLSDEVAVELPVLLHTVNDLERIGDHAVNIVELAERKIAQKIVFTNEAQGEAGQLGQEVDQMFDRILTALKNNDNNSAKTALEDESTINRMQITFRRSHVDRMSQGLCTAESGLIFIDLVDNVEKIGDHLTNIAQAIIGGLQWEGVKPRISASN